LENERRPSPDGTILHGESQIFCNNVVLLRGFQKLI